MEEDNKSIFDDTLPLNLEELKTIIDQQRRNKFDYEGFNRVIDNGQVITCTLNDESYIVALNCLDNLHTLFKPDGKQTFKDLLKEDLVKDIFDKMTLLENNEFPVLALYDFIKFKEDTYLGSEETKEKFEMKTYEKLVKFQSFKYYFFEKYPELRKFRDISIVHDMFLL